MCIKPRDRGILLRLHKLDTHKPVNRRCYACVLIRKAATSRSRAGPSFETEKMSRAYTEFHRPWLTTAHSTENPSVRFVCYNWYYIQ